MLLLPLKKGHLIFKKNKIFIVHEDFNHMGKIDFIYIGIFFIVSIKSGNYLFRLI